MILTLNARVPENYLQLPNREFEEEALIPVLLLTR